MKQGEGCMYHLCNFPVNLENTKLKSLFIKEIVLIPWGWMELINHYTEDPCTFTIIACFTAVVVIVILLSKVTSLVHRCQACGPLASPEIRVLSLLLGFLAGVILTQGGILNLNKMVEQVTRKTPIFSYWPYGCHCGLGGKGQPKDATDW